MPNRGTEQEGSSGQIWGPQTFKVRHGATKAEIQEEQQKPEAYLKNMKYQKPVENRVTKTAKSNAMDRTIGCSKENSNASEMELQQREKATNQIMVA